MVAVHVDVSGTKCLSHKLDHCHQLHRASRPGRCDLVANRKPPQTRTLAREARPPGWRSCLEFWPVVELGCRSSAPRIEWEDGLCLKNAQSNAQSVVSFAVRPERSGRGNVCVHPAARSPSQRDAPSGQRRRQKEAYGRYLVDFQVWERDARSLMQRFLLVLVGEEFWA